ncbi:MAG: ABC transporter substrate-binding protein [Bacillota bacterium]
MKKWLFLSMIFAMMIVFTIGCGVGEDKATDEKETTVEPKTKNEAEDNNAFPVTVVDGTGEEVTIDSEPQAIVSVIPSNTEITFALGQGDKVIGVDDYSNYPPEVQDIEKIGAQEMNVEKILALQPDLALVTDFQHENNADILQQFKDAGINVIVIESAESFENVYNTISLIGQVTGAPEEAETIVQEMKDRLTEIKEKAKAVTEKKRVWVEVSPAPDIFTTGQDTFMHEMLESINAVNTAGEQTGWVKLTEEEIVTLNPDVIITTYGFYVKNPAEGVLGRAGWEEVPAIKAEQVYDVNNDTVTRPGPRLIDGVETLAKLIYPEIFGE